MKAVLHLFVVLVLLLQGVPTVMAAQDTTAEQVMPCHGMAPGDAAPAKTMSCCDGASHLCNAICAAPALPVRISLPELPRLSFTMDSAPHYTVLAAHRAPLLRPPSPLSA